MTIVPLALARVGYKGCQEIGLVLAKGIKDYARDVLIVASTDMTHYESAGAAHRKDGVLIKRIEALDPEGLVRERDQRRITMCGVGPVAATIVAAKACGAARVQSLAYSTSGDVMPASEVVGYYCGVIRR